MLDCFVDSPTAEEPVQTEGEGAKDEKSTIEACLVSVGDIVVHIVDTKTPSVGAKGSAGDSGPIVSREEVGVLNSACVGR